MSQLLLGALDDSAGTAPVVAVAQCFGRLQPSRWIPRPRSACSSRGRIARRRSGGSHSTRPTESCGSEPALLGEAFSDDDLRRILELVAATTTRSDEQIAHMFGGRMARQAVGSEQEPPEHEKPGSSGYL